MSQLHCCELAIFENAADGHTCENVSHANQVSLSGNSSAIFETMHTCITLCNQSVPGTKQYENNEPNVTLPAKRCRSARKMTMALGSFYISAIITNKNSQNLLIQSKNFPDQTQPQTPINSELHITHNRQWFW